MEAKLGISEIITDKREAILKIASQHGAYGLKVFGSVARGEATEDSDIDFLVDYDLKKISPWFPVGLIHDLEELLQRKVDVVPANSIHPFIRDRIFQEAVEI
jgi:predicted nucleotidyltransferase